MAKRICPWGALVAITLLARSVQAASDHRSFHCVIEAGGAGFAWKVVAQTGTGSGEVMMEGKIAAVHVANEWWATPPPANLDPESTHGDARLLEFVDRKETTGTDDIGSYIDVEVQWRASPPGTSPPVLWETSCRAYPVLPHEGGTAVVFSSGFSGGATDTAVPSATADDGVLSHWPLAQTLHTNLTTAVSWEGEFLGPTSGLSHGVAGGPNVFYSDMDPLGRITTPVVASPLNHFKVASSSHTSFDGSAVAWAPGTAGTVKSLPAGFKHSWLLYSPEMGAGVTAAVREYGSLLQRLHNTSRVDDITVEKLQYQVEPPLCSPRQPAFPARPRTHLLCGKVCVCVV